MGAKGWKVRRQAGGSPRAASAPPAPAKDGGPRQCIGKGFALMEAQLLLAMICRRFELDLVPGLPVEPHALATLRRRRAFR